MNQEQEKNDMADKIQGQGVVGSRRERYWGECSIEQKIERMRNIVRSMQEENHYLRELLSGLVSKFNSHSHEAQRVMIPVSLGLESDIGRFGIARQRKDSASGDDCYF